MFLRKPYSGAREYPCGGSHSRDVRSTGSPERLLRTARMRRYTRALLNQRLQRRDDWVGMAYGYFDPLGDEPTGPAKVVGGAAVCSARAGARSSASCVKLHEKEFNIDDGLVRRLIARQSPQWANLSLRRIHSSGTVNLIYRLGQDIVVRLPRTPDFGGGPLREARWMPVFAPRLPVTVPEHLLLGVPTVEYPSHWSVLEWVEGAPASRETLDDMTQAAVRLGEFVASLRTVPTEGAPEGGNYRGLGLRRMDGDFRGWAERLPSEIDRDAVATIWEDCLTIDEYSGKPQWLHTDLKGDNLIARDGQLAAVIDWEGCTVGDPSADLLAAWWLFDGDSREAFRVAAGARHDEWVRAKGWALHMAVAAIPYYHDTNPAFAIHARLALDQILHDPD